MNYPKMSQYSGLCGAKGDMVIYTEEISRYDRYGTASRFPCVSPGAKKIAEDVDLLDPLGWIGPEDLT